MADIVAGDDAWFKCIRLDLASTSTSVRHTCTHDSQLAGSMSFNNDTLLLYNYSWKSTSKDRPVVYWTPRERQVVSEGDIVQNYDLIKEYLYCVGHETPLPHQVHHEAIIYIYFNFIFFSPNWLSWGIPSPLQPPNLKHLDMRRPSSCWVWHTIFIQLYMKFVVVGVWSAILRCILGSFTFKPVWMIYIYISTDHATMHDCKIYSDLPW